MEPDEAGSRPSSGGASSETGGINDILKQMQAAAAALQNVVRGETDLEVLSQFKKPGEGATQHAAPATRTQRTCVSVQVEDDAEEYRKAVAAIVGTALIKKPRTTGVTAFSPSELDCPDIRATKPAVIKEWTAARRREAEDDDVAEPSHPRAPSSFAAKLHALWADAGESVSEDPSAGLLRLENKLLLQCLRDVEAEVVESVLDPDSGMIMANPVWTLDGRVVEAKVGEEASENLARLQEIILWKMNAMITTLRPPQQNIVLGTLHCPTASRFSAERGCLCWQHSTKPDDDDDELSEASDDEAGAGWASYSAQETLHIDRAWAEELQQVYQVVTSEGIGQFDFSKMSVTVVSRATKTTRSIRRVWLLPTQSREATIFFWQRAERLLDEKTRVDRRKAASLAGGAMRSAAVTRTKAVSSKKKFECAMDRKWLAANEGDGRLAIAAAEVDFRHGIEGQRLQLLEDAKRNYLYHEEGRLRFVYWSIEEGHLKSVFRRKAKLEEIEQWKVEREQRFAARKEVEKIRRERVVDREPVMTFLEDSSSGDEDAAVGFSDRFLQKIRVQLTRRNDPFIFAPDAAAVLPGTRPAAAGAGRRHATRPQAGFSRGEAAHLWAKECRFCPGPVEHERNHLFWVGAPAPPGAPPPRLRCVRVSRATVVDRSQRGGTRAAEPAPRGARRRPATGRAPTRFVFA
eukprot:gene11451-17616_t